MNSWKNLLPSTSSGTNKTFSRTFAVLLFFGSLGGCGGGAESLEGLGNLNPPATDSDGDGVANPIASNEVNVRVDATSGMTAATVTQNIFYWLTPAPAMALDAGEAVSASIKVQQLDFSGDVINSGAVISNSDYFVSSNGDGTYTIIFDNGIPDRIDLVISATLSNGTVMRRGLPNLADGVVLNAGTEYAVQKFFTSFENQSDLDDLLPCSTSGCEDQSEVHLVNWLALNKAVLDFETTIPDTSDLDDAVELLNSDPLIASYVDQFIESIKETKVDSIDDQSISPAMANRSGNYNAVMFSLGMNQGLPDKDAAEQTVVFANRTSDVRTNTSGDVVSYTYPKVVVSSNILGVTGNVLIEQIPWYRNSLNHRNDDTFDNSTASRDDEINKQEGTVLTYLSPKGHFDMARLQTQVVTDEGSSSPTGWLNNPFFTRYYSTKAGNDDDETSEGIASAFISDGLVLRLSENSSGEYERVESLERPSTFGWLYAVKTTETDDFSIDLLDFNDYAVVSLTQTLSATTPAITVQASIDQWTISGDEAQLTQPTLGGGDPEIFNTYTTGRNVDLTANVVATTTGATDSLAIEALSSKVKITDDDIYKGRLSVGDWTGASDPLGNVMAFRTNTESGSQGIAHAIKLSSSSVNLANSTYVLYGNTFMATDAESVFSNYNMSTLAFNASSVATLTLKELRVTQTIGSAELSTPTDNSAAYVDQPTASKTANANPDYQNLIKLDFADPTGGATPFILEGFIASEGNILILLVRYGEQLGLFYAFKEQSLTSTSD